MNSPDVFLGGSEVTDMEEAMRRKAAQEYLATNGFEEYNTPDKFRAGVETRDQNVFLEEDTEKPRELTLEKILSMNRNEIPAAVDDGSPNKDGSGRLSPKLERLANLLYATEDGDVRELQEEAADKTGAAYTEGGLVFLPEQDRGEGGSPCVATSVLDKAAVGQ